MFHSTVKPPRACRTGSRLRPGAAKNASESHQDGSGPYCGSRVDLCNAASAAAPNPISTSPVASVRPSRSSLPSPPSKIAQPPPGPLSPLAGVHFAAFWRQLFGPLDFNLKCSFRPGFASRHRRHAKQNTELERLESEAKAAKLGPWSYKEPIPPWELASAQGGWAGVRRYSKTIWSFY